MHVLWAVFVRDFYTPVWPNIAASALTGVAVVKRVKTHIRRSHDHQMKWIKAIHSGVTTDGGTNGAGE